VSDAETPMQKALRLKKAALDKRAMHDKGKGSDAPKNPGATSKPWMKR